MLVTEPEALMSIAPPAKVTLAVVVAKILTAVVAVEFVKSPPSTIKLPVNFKVSELAL